jgi:glutamine synthetase
MARISELSEYLLDVLSALSVAGVDVEQLHPENAVGQFEVSVAAEDPLGAADTAVLVRETIRAVTLRHGMRASYAPKVELGLTGNGGHVHLSLWRDGANLMSGGDGPYGMGDEAEAFAAGVLARLPALLAVGCPSVASYLRLLPASWAGAFACWGLENREAALRLVTGPAWRQRRAANLEIKCFDATANPYLVLAVILAAGRAGLTVDRAAGKDRLPEPVTVDPASLTPAERAARGITALPSSLEESVAAFEREQVLRDALGPPLADTIADVRRGEIALFAGAEPEAIIARTRWRH